MKIIVAHLVICFTWIATGGYKKKLLRVAVPA